MYDGSLPPLPSRRPHPDDELPYGVHFFRTWVGSGRPFGLQSPPDDESGIGEQDFENLTLPRTFFGRSEISRISFKNTDLSESWLCWNDFIEVNFTAADLSGSELRASLYTRVVFVGTHLRGADLRRSTYKDCDFAGADMAGAKLTREQGEKLLLSEQQKLVIDWQEDDGEEPPGG
jgi:uncharacterized protein YjbI with pentapeptide repeats